MQMHVKALGTQQWVTMFVITEGSDYWLELSSLTVLSSVMLVVVLLVTNAHNYPRHLLPRLTSVKHALLLYA